MPKHLDKLLYNAYESYDNKDKNTYPEEPLRVFDPINIETNITVDIATGVKVEVTTNMELKPILNESVEKLIDFLAITEKVPVEETNELDSFSSERGNKALVTKTLRDMEGRKLEAIIP
ncbi:hypothetical protein PVK06_007395 [Gossypium arboreum]|uniref:Uncharacterized protein n=1 Tax=Gossypium arboreum TaxID=29729 RepID=A0ABR0QH69_GOSAR|nr:hypothetical protein PVK06_007395 [Gossypium arboreum]